jgi:enamine deaminase RidA (YjgF/YER057c/UK114 family)
LTRQAGIGTSRRPFGRSGDKEPTMIKRIGNHGVLHQIVEYNGILHIGGIVADDPSLGMADQTTQALTKLARLLEENGSGVDRILQILVFITDMKLKPEMNRAWKAFFNNPDHLPTRATLGISAIEEGVLIEIVTTAACK